MKKIALAMIAALTLAIAGGPAYAAYSSGSKQPAIYTPAGMKWMPGTGDMKGLSVAVLEGNPATSGPFTIRIKLPSGTKFPVHYHDDTERLTVISGTFLAAVGNKYDATKFIAMPAGSYAVIPAGVRHFASVKGDTIIQLTGNGPFGMKMDKMSDHGGAGM